MLFHAKNNTAKWKGRNVFPYSVTGMSQVVSTKRVLALVACKVVASNFPTEINSNGNNFNRPKKVNLKPTLQCTYVNTAKRQHLYSCFQKRE